MSIQEMYEKRPRNFIKNLLITAVVISLVVWSGNGIAYNGIAAKGGEIASGMFYGLMSPDKSYLFSLATDGVPYLILQTLAIAVLGTVFGAILAIPFSFLAAENITGKYVSFFVRAFILLIRTIPSLVWALMWIRVTGPGPICGVVTQSICSIGMISKMFITAIEDLDNHILESLDAMGCNTFEKIRVGVIPQLTASFISTTIYRFDINLKDASVLGIVGAGGIGAAMIQAINSRRWSIVGAFLWALIILSLIIEVFSTRIRSKLVSGER